MPWKLVSSYGRPWCLMGLENQDAAGVTACEYKTKRQALDAVRAIRKVGIVAVPLKGACPHELA